MDTVIGVLIGLAVGGVIGYLIARLRAGDGAAGLEALAWLHYRVRYGGEPDTVLAVEARAAFQSLRRLPRRRRA